MNKRGFTLIELLVVIAIIGILASIVLVSLGGARDRAKDARIIADMGQLRTVATIFDGNNGSFTGLCADADVDVLEADIVAQGGSTPACSADAGSFCIKTQLNNNNWWCVDSQLRSQQSSTEPTAANCGTTPFVCE